MNIMDKINREQCKEEITKFNIGDTLKVYSKIVEGSTERLQAFTGTLIARNGSGIQETITLRRVAFGQGIEKVIPLHSPRLAKIEIVRQGKVRRAKLYYLRDKIGKAAKVKEKRIR